MAQENSTPSPSRENNTSLLAVQENAENTQPMPPIQIFQQFTNKLIELLSDVKIIKEVISDIVNQDSFKTQFETAIYDTAKDLQLLKNRLCNHVRERTIFDCQWEDSFNQVLDERDDIIALIKDKRAASKISKTLKRTSGGFLQGLTNTIFSRNQAPAAVSVSVATQFEALVTSMYKQLMSRTFARECAIQMVVECDPDSQEEAHKLYEKALDKLQFLSHSLRLYNRLYSIESLSFDLVKRQVPSFDQYPSVSSAIENESTKYPSQISTPKTPKISQQPKTPSQASDPSSNNPSTQAIPGSQPPAPLPPSPFAKKVSLEDYFRTQYIAGIPEGLNDVILPIAAAYDSRYSPLIQQLGIIPERGMILYGPPGTGKTLMAQAIAGYLGCPDERIMTTTGSSLLDRWVGSTEASIRSLFYPARKNRDHLHMIIIDEIDAILTTRQKAQNSWERTQVTQFLTELDGIKSPKNVFVIGITNCVEHLDPAAIRPGRLGNLIGVPLPDVQQRARIFELHLSFISECRLATSYACMAQALSDLTDGFSGADIRAVVQRTANMTFMSTIRAGHFKDSEDIAECDKPITTNDFVPVIEFIAKQKSLAAYS